MERWRDVVGYSGLYRVSDLGRVMSVDRVVQRVRFGRVEAVRRKGKVMTPVTYGQHGHVAVNLTKDGVKRLVSVSRTVAAAWIGPCPDGQEVRHGAAGSADNSVSNLCYGTKSQNNYDKRRDGTHGGRRVVRSDGAEFINMHVAAEESGCSYQHIWSCCAGRRKTTGGYGWRYCDD